MGPRLINRGETAVVAEAGAYVRLQWGRGL